MNTKQKCGLQKPRPPKLGPPPDIIAANLQVWIQDLRWGVEAGADERWEKKMLLFQQVEQEFFPGKIFPSLLKMSKAAWNDGTILGLHRLALRHRKKNSVYHIQN